MKGRPKSPSEIRRETKRLDAWARRELKNVMRKAVTRMVAAGEGKRLPITGESAAEYRELSRSLRNAIERAVAFSDGRPIPSRDCARHEDSDGPPEAFEGLADSLEAAQAKLFKALRPPHKVRSVATHGEEKVLNGRRPMDAPHAKRERPGVNDQPPRLQSRKPKP